MTNGEGTITGPLGIWKFPMVSRGMQNEKAKIGGEGFMGRMMDKAPGIIIQNVSTAAAKIAGQAAKEAATQKLTGLLGRGFGLLG